jgi:hypothetical protein
MEKRRKIFGDMTEEEIMNAISNDTESVFRMFRENIGSTDNDMMLVLTSMQSCIVNLYAKFLGSEGSAEFYYTIADNLSDRAYKSSMEWKPQSPETRKKDIAKIVKKAISRRIESENIINKQNSPKPAKKITIRIHKNNNPSGNTTI